MEIFISWSGELSKSVATCLNKFLCNVIQATKPFLSAEHIDKGSVWFNQISDKLSSAKYGIICVDSINSREPWMLFEAGALYKGLGHNRVTPFLVNIPAKDLLTPLSHFHAVLFSREDVLRLVNSINTAQEPGNRLDDSRLSTAFKMYWPTFEECINKIIPEYSKEGGKLTERPVEELIGEILDISRDNSRILAGLAENTAQYDPTIHGFISSLPITSIGGYPMSSQTYPASGVYTVDPTRYKFVDSSQLSVKSDTRDSKKNSDDK